MLIRRALLASAIATATVLGTTACNLTSPVASLEKYAPSDGVQADIGAIKARNLIYFVAPNGNAALYGAFVNSSAQTSSFILSYKDPQGKRTFRSFTIDAYQVLNFGYQKRSPLKISLPGKPGDVAEIYLSDGDINLQKIKVPVMDGTLPEYRDLIDKLANN